MTYTEMLGRCNNSVPAFDAGVARGDIREKDGMSYWKRHIDSVSVQVDNVKDSTLDSNTSDTAETLWKQSIGNLGEWAKLDMPSVEAKAQAQASKEDWARLQEAYDAMTTCLSKVKELSRELMRLSSSSQSDTSKNLVRDATTCARWALE